MKKKFQPNLWAAIFTLLALIILLGLGTWQIKRLGEKNLLLSNINSQMSIAAVPMPAKISNPKEWRFRRVTLAGVFDYNHEFLIKPRTLNGANGYHMFVPFKRLSGGIVMVNRGWISDSLISKASRPSGILKIEGVIKLPYKTSYTPENNIEKNDWYWPDLNAMAHKFNLRQVAPVIVNIAEREVGVYPAGGKISVNIHNNHKQYSYFWYSMAFILFVIFLFSCWKEQLSKKPEE